jgi:hypothetical protein
MKSELELHLAIFGTNSSLESLEKKEKKTKRKKNQNKNKNQT